MRHNASLLVAIGLPCVVGLTVLAPGIAHNFFGESFRAAAIQIIPLIALGAFLEGLKAYHFDSAFQFVHQTIYHVLGVDPRTQFLDHSGRPISAADGGEPIRELI